MLMGKQGAGMPRELTAKQAKFAALVASGSTKVGAYRQVYPGKANKVTQWMEAQRVAKVPKVRAEIHRLQLLTLPQVEDLAALRQHTVAVMVGLSIGAQNEALRMKAAAWLHEIATKELAARRAGPEEGASDVLADLRSLYRRALRTEAGGRPLAVVAGQGAANGAPMSSTTGTEAGRAERSTVRRGTGPSTF